MERPKLLLADDSVTIRKVVELTFADEGVDVTAVADSDAAMQRFVEIEPDIVLVDATLAGTSGYRICEMIKADDATKHIPVLLLVGSFERFDDGEAERVGADGFMTKPFRSIRELVSKVRDLLEGSHGSGAGEDGKGAGAPPVPVFGEEFLEGHTAAEPAKPESAAPAAYQDDDIEHLYRESFGNETATDKSNRVHDEDLGYVGMDDDMIEASYQPPRFPLEEEDAPDIPLRDNYDPETKFDWSPEELVREADPAAGDTFETRFVVAADKPELESDSSKLSESNTAETGKADISGIAMSVMDRPATSAAAEPSFDSGDDDEILDLDETPAPQDFVLHPSDELPPVTVFQPETELDPAPRRDVDEPEVESTNKELVSENSADDRPDPAIHETIPYSTGEQPPIHIPENVPQDEKFPAEVIDMIAQRVIEKLSDSVVREVARIEVPRVAEKLIREALDGKR